MSHNDANNNERGIAVEGTNSLVTHNTANDNIITGLEVQCPRTVTNNSASGNGQDHTFVGTGCFTKNNN